MSSPSKNHPPSSHYIKSNKHITFSYLSDLTSFQKGTLGDTDTYLVGILHLNYSKPQQIKNIHLNLRGAEKTSWHKAQARSKALYSGEQVLVDQNFKIWESHEDETNITKLDVQFNIKLPYNLPESIITETGSVNYVIKATINRKGSVMYSATQSVEIHCPLRRTIMLDNNNNTPHKLRGESRCGLDYTFVLPPSKNLNLGSYVTIPMRIKFLKAGVSVERVEINLKSCMDFRCNNPNETRHVKEQVASLLVPRQEIKYTQSTSQNYEGECLHTINLFIPRTVQPTYSGRFISITHQLVIKFCLWGADDDFQIEEGVRVANILEKTGYTAPDLSAELLDASPSPTSASLPVTAVHVSSNGNQNNQNQQLIINRSLTSSPSIPPSMASNNNLPNHNNNHNNDQPQLHHSSSYNSIDNSSPSVSSYPTPGYYDHDDISIIDYRDFNAIDDYNYLNHFPPPHQMHHMHHPMNTPPHYLNYNNLQQQQFPPPQHEIDPDLHQERKLSAKALEYQQQLLLQQQQPHYNQYSHFQHLQPTSLPSYDDGYDEKFFLKKLDDFFFYNHLNSSNNSSNSVNENNYYPNEKKNYPNEKNNYYYNNEKKINNNYKNEKNFNNNERFNDYYRKQYELAFQHRYINNQFPITMPNYYNNRSLNNNNNNNLNNIASSTTSTLTAQSSSATLSTPPAATNDSTSNLNNNTSSSVTPSSNNSASDINKLKSSPTMNTIPPPNPSVYNKEGMAPPSPSLSATKLPPYEKSNSLASTTPPPEALISPPPYRGLHPSHIPHHFQSNFVDPYNYNYEEKL
nr:2693_t:CDS:2 [Entrophospora candida]